MVTNDIVLFRYSLEIEDQPIISQELVKRVLEKAPPFKTLGLDGIPHRFPPMHGGGTSTFPSKTSPALWN